MILREDGKGEKHMRSVNVTYKIYEFSELSEDAKAKVKKWYLDNFYQNEEFSDICKEDLSHRFPKSDLKVQYSLSYCQGDGLNVYGTLNLKDVLYNLSITPLTSFKPEDSFTEKEKRTLCCYAKECGWEITLPQNHRYTYCIVDRIDFTEEWEYILTEITPPFKNLNKKLMNRFQQYIVDLFTKFCAELEAAGYHFFYSIDDEAIKNVCDINEWMFLEDGTLFSA